MVGLDVSSFTDVLRRLTAGQLKLPKATLLEHPFVRAFTLYRSSQVNVETPGFAVEVLLGIIDPPSSFQPESILAKHETAMITELRRLIRRVHINNQSVLLQQVILMYSQLQQMSEPANSLLKVDGVFVNNSSRALRSTENTLRELCELATR